MIKRAALLATVIIITLLSCKKENIVKEGELSATVYFMKFKVDGVQKIYEQKLYSSRFYAQPYNYLDNDGKYYSAFFGGKDDISDHNSIMLNLVSTSPLVVGETYVNFPINNDKQTYLSYFVFVYQDEKGYKFLDLGNAISNLHGINSEGYAQITQVTNNDIKGIFKATLYNDDYTKNVKITDGEFYLKRLIQ